ncbi:hypothetical protein EU803_02235 [Loktanella sp. IMCC34160]|uniref:phosphate/phosphite/phosphonate ABC transporter substrate-binding protein n=1 Tax=Loktanella sp. IMCC34160 TaxID=2510646 RepID=UPI00101C7BD5|nr:PhnD/SsuA/transferrin family substrate-binding protein [Loktanella sp. IMCC34160]RYG92947.1 hypothetical protein EU803_02235 [Loktanella sp. IMCC34160]
MYAALPMYDRPQHAAAHDALWVLIRDGLRGRGIAATDVLDRDTGHMDGWARPDLVLSQICNLPWRARFRGKVTLIGAADYGIPGVDPGYYTSVFVVRADDPATDPATCADYRLAYNEPLSNSGYGAPQLWAAARGFQFTPHIRTGSHRDSMEAVAEGRADIAAIDAHTYWVQGQIDDPLVPRLRVIGTTDATPGMTFVTRPGQDPAPYFAAIAEAIAALPARHSETLRLRGIHSLPDSAYDIPLPTPPEEVPDRQVALAVSGKAT